MTFEELLRERSNIEYQIRVNNMKVTELKHIYFKSGGGNGGIHTKNNTSPQEIIILRIDALEHEIFNLQQKLIEIDEQIDEKLKLIDNTEFRMIVFKRINGYKWKTLESDYSESYIKKIYADSLKLIAEREREQL